MKKWIKNVLELIWGSKYYKETKPKRARTEKGYYRADDKSTAYTNEAWVGGKAPKRGKK